jgi:hypothetical protein
MAIVRCEQHSPPTERTRHYVGRIHPLGYPVTGVLCGLRDCDQPGLIWLEQREMDAYRAGERVFDVLTRRVKVRAQ